MRWRTPIVCLAASMCLVASQLAGQTPAGPGTPPIPATGAETSASAAPKTAIGSTAGEGRIPLIQFLGWLQEHSGKIVQYPSTAQDPPFNDDITIHVLREITNLSYPVVEAILEFNGYELTESLTEDGQEIINVRHSGSRGKVTAVDVTPLVGPGGAVPPDVNENRKVTLVMQLKHTDTNTVAQALQTLLIPGGGAARGADAPLNIVNISASNTLIIKAKAGLISHIRDLVTYIDIEEAVPEALLDIREVFNADAQELVSIITEILNIQGGGIRGSRRANPAAGGGAAPPAARTTSGQVTNLTADTRTQKIIVQTTIEEEMDLVLRLVDELDVKVDFLRTNTHVYRVKFLKAADLAEDLDRLVTGAQSRGGLSTAARGRTSRRTRNQPATPAGQQPQLGQQPYTPTHIVPHDETNSLLIQAEPEEYDEILRVLEKIDRKRRQVFLEAALVQVNESSALNYTLEYLAGTLDDRDTRLAALSAFGLSTLDPTQLPTNFTRVVSQNAPQTGLLAAASSNGQLPLLMRAIKSDTDSKIVATPFILADDNQENSISIQTEIFFTTNTLNNNFSQGGQDSEDAGINLNLLPTISQEVVLLELELEVSSFAGAPTSAGVLPDRSTNTITSRVTIADGDIFIIGGLARESNSLSISKIPFLGDIPILGYLFQSRSADKRRDNLYVFLTCHIIQEEDNQLEKITATARSEMSSFGENIRVQQFDPKKLRGTAEPPAPEKDAGEDKEDSDEK